MMHKLLLRPCRTCTIRCLLSTSSAPFVPPTPGGSQAHYPSLDFAAWKLDPAGLQQNAINRGIHDLDVQQLLSLHGQLTGLMTRRQKIEAKRNQLGKGKAAIDPEDREEAEKDFKEWVRRKGKELKVEYFEVKEQEAALRQQVYQLAAKVPNSTHPDVVVGPEENARVIKEIGVKPEFDFTPKHHVELGIALDWFDFENSTTISGARTVMLKNMGAALELALANWVNKFINWQRKFQIQPIRMLSLVQKRTRELSRKLE
eukprot:TRINITY_DN9993_c0_g1_i3.p1 TRINITY_DN9993_c0_g1~~TRINITY_DN9993_c0_g1_i3.p1  ORF type:complete len:259 (-),score=69.14 TRINITY_DN9993_c0_g1_i3:241-1017(-)